MDGPPDDAAAPPPPTILPSHEPTTTHEGEGYRLGYGSGGKGFYGVWNKTSGASERFPLTQEGWGQAWKRFAGLERQAAAEVTRAFVDSSWDTPRTAGIRIPEGPVMEECAVCHRKPTDRFRFNANQGYLLTRRRSTFNGPLCRDCARGTFRAFQSKNMARGWWGLISFFATLGYLASNSGEMRKAKALADPMPSVDDERERALRGRPVLARPLSWIGLLLLAAVLVAGYAFSRGSAAGASSIEDDFSDPSSGWLTIDRPGVTAHYEGGRYRIRIDKGSEIIDKVLPVAFPAITVEIVARKTASYSGEGFHGVGCVASHERRQAYHFLVDPDTTEFLIIRVDQGRADVLGRGVDAAVLASDNPNDVQARCSSSGGRVNLSFVVNGKRVTSVMDDGGFDTFEGLSLVVISGDTSTDVTFSRASMRKL